MSRRCARALLSLLATGFGVAVAASPHTVHEARPAYGAILRVPCTGAEFRPRAYVVKNGTWEVREAADGLEPDKDGNRTCFIPLKAGAKGDVDGRCAFRDADGAVRAEWSLTPQEKAVIRHLELRGTLPLEDYAGGAFVADGVRAEIPVVNPKSRCFDRTVRRLTLFDVHGRERMTIDFGAARRVGVEMAGDPKIGGKLILCIPLADCPAPGVAAAVVLTVSAPGGLKIGPDGNYVISGGQDWVPFKPAKTVVAGSPLDFSALRPTGAPAGKWGRIVAKGDDFEFEGRPGVPARFYGVNLCTRALCPETKTEADALAVRLARMGYNAVRIHHQESELLERAPDGITPDPVKLARFDALVAACVANGLYLTTDLFCSRSWNITWRSVGFDRDGTIGMGDFKALVQVHEGVYSNYLAFARNFLTHKNVYTGRSLAEVPALGWISLVNEGCLGSNTAYLESFVAWRTMWKKWLATKKERSPADYTDIPEKFPENVMAPTRHATAFKLFLSDIERRFARRTRRFLREELGCKALLCDMNGVFHPMHTRLARVKPYDYVDGHFYQDHPSFLGQNWKPPSTAGTGNPAQNAMGAIFPTLAKEWGKPFTITEWNYCAPNPYRAGQGLFVGAAAAFQGWGGLWHFDFAGDRTQYADPDSVGLGPFVMTGDPVMRAADLAAVCLYLRGDLPEARDKFASVVPKDVFARPADVGPSEDTWHHLNWLTWYGKVGMVTAADALPDGVREVFRYPDDYAHKSLATIRQRALGLGEGEPLPSACGGAVRIDAKKGTFVVETPRTCGGHVPGGAFAAGPLRVRADDREPTALWVSALDGVEIAASRRLLLVHLVDTVGTGITFTDESRKIILDWGKSPQLVRKTSADVALTLPQGAWKVSALSEEGRVRYAVPARYENGALRFTASTAGRDGVATFHYVVEKQCAD